MGGHPFFYPFTLSLLWLLVLILFSLPVRAATFTVTNLNDSGPDSLRQAILDTNVAASDDAIVFSSSLSGTITLTSGQLGITGNLTINGPGADTLTISGNPDESWRIFVIETGATVNIEGLTLKEGGGGGILNRGTLTVSHNTLSRNHSAGYDRGGGIDNLGTLTVSHSTLSDNSTGGFSSGGGGISSSATAVVTHTTLSGNSSSGYWSVGGGINNTGVMTVIYSTVSGNGARNDSGIANSGTLILTNSTVSGNGGGWNAGGIGNDGTLTLINSTVTGNSVTTAGGGIVNRGTLTLGNTIVAGNNAPTGKEINNYNQGRFISLGHNLFGENGDAGLASASPAATDIIPPVGVNISRILAPLSDNGGPTLTHLLVPDSPAINAGDNALIPAGVVTDQRDQPRIQPINGTVDTGATEFPAPVCATPTVTIHTLATASHGWFRITGAITLDGAPLCALVLANGQFMFTCGDPLPKGDFDLTVPPDAQGQITLFGFSAGLAPFQQTFSPSPTPP